MGSNDLTIRDGWIARVLRALNVVEVDDDGQTTHVAGSDFVSAQPAKQDYAAIDSMSAIAAFPFVRACVESIASDLTKLPIRVIKGRGADAEVIEDHPLLALLDRPSSRVSGVVFRRQLITDMVLTGNAYVLIAGAPEPAAMLRLHPERVRIIPAPDGQPMAYEYDGYGSMIRYEFDQVLHIRQTSWAASPTMLYGTGAIQALNNDLKTDQAASKLAAESASTGLPTGILSPSEEGDRWTKNQIAQLREGFERQLRSKSGTVILGAGIDYTQMSQTLRDMEYQATREHVIRSILAAMGVPPVIVGLPNANYATAQAQRRQFAESQQARASLIDSELTRLARMFPDSEDVRVFHDFADVDALQESRTERVNRVQTWWFMGLSVEDAAALEGFEELTTSEPTTDDREEEPEPTEEPETAGVIRLLFGGDAETRGLSDLTQPIQEGLRRKAEDHNEDMDDRGMAEWRKTTAGTLARVFERGIGAYETNPESVRPSVNSAEQWAYARVNSFLYALRNDRFRSGRHDTDLLPDEHPMASDEEKTKAVGDVDPTNFPQDGDDKTVNLRNSNHKVFDPEFAERIKLDYPSIWRKGGNIKGNDQFRKLRPIALAGGVVETRAEEKAVRDREAWAARHAGDFRIAGVIAQVKWLVVGNRGEKYMKDLIREEIENFGKLREMGMQEALALVAVEPSSSLFQQEVHRELQCTQGLDAEAIEHALIYDLGVPVPPHMTLNAKRQMLAEARVRLAPRSAPVFQQDGPQSKLNLLLAERPVLSALFAELQRTGGASALNVAFLVLLMLFAAEHSIALGLILTPLIARLEEFIALRDRLRAERTHLRALKDLRSLRLRHMRRAISALPFRATDDPEVADILTRFAGWPRSDALSRLGLDRLSAHLQASSDLCNRIDDWLEKHRLSSGEPAENFRPFTQNTKEEIQKVRQLRTSTC